MAGNGNSGFSGDGRAATSATLSLPQDVAVGNRGKFYIADWISFRVRVVNRSGIIQTLAGSGAFGYNGDGLAATQTNLLPGGVTVRNGAIYVSDQTSYRIRKVH